MDEDEVPSAPVWVWLTLSLITCISFWSQATVTEERLVPALNVISDYYNIPDDIAGATLMAAGASSPELFSSLVSLFITKSSLGLGTIVGSEIFNQLIICAGAVYASKTGKLQLDRAVVIREVGFYALAIFLLYIALQDVEPVDDDVLGNDHIFISFWESLMLFSGYIAYVIVCANMESIVAFVTRTQQGLRSEMTSYGAMESTHKMQLDLPPIPYVTQKKNLSSEPASNWSSVEYFMPSVAHDRRASLGESISNDPNEDAEDSLNKRTSFLASSIRNSIEHIGNESLFSLIRHSERPSELHSVHDLEINEYNVVLRCFLWQRSVFYTKAYFGSHAWHLRWFTITPEKISSVPDRQDPDKHRMTYPRFNEINIDEDRLIISIVHPNPKKRDFTLMAPSKAIFDIVVTRFEECMKLHTTEQHANGSTATDKEEEEEEEEHDDADAHIDLIEFPTDGSNLEIFFWIILSPFRFLMHYTVPDVRQLDRNGDPTASIEVAYFATFMCLLWLIAGSYFMVACLEKLAELMNIPDAVIGVTVSAAGTSLPNYVASKVAAENGFGNQAVSNAFGSNTFNIMVGLGLPWLLYTSFGTGFEPYHGLEAEGILESIIILACVLLVFVVLMLQTGFVIYKWHGNLFIALYFAYIALAIGQVYL